MSEAWCSLRGKAQVEQQKENTKGDPKYSEPFFAKSHFLTAYGKESTVRTPRGIEKVVGPLPEIIDLIGSCWSVFGNFTNMIIEISSTNGYVVLGFILM
jgi:hypothetical protein